VLGYVLHAPPISVGTGPQMFTEDWSMINIYRDKINWNEFQGNVVDLGTFRSILRRSSTSLTIISSQDLTLRICPENAPAPRGPQLVQVPPGRPPAS
jgi:hypothetical protein